MNPRLNVFLILISCISCATESSEPTNSKTEIQVCTCILDDLTVIRTSGELSSSAISKEIEGELSPDITGSIREIIDLDLLLRLSATNKQDTTRGKYVEVIEGITYPQEFLQKYMLERGLFCAKYQAICRDSTIDKSIKTQIYIAEIDKLGDFLRQNIEEKSTPIVPLKKSNRVGDQPTINQNLDSTTIEGDNINVIQGDNSLFDNRKIINKNLDQRRIPDSLIQEISSILSQCEGTNVDIRLFNQDSETQIFATDFLKIIELAGLKNVGTMFYLRPMNFVGTRIYMNKEFSNCHALILNQLYYKFPQFEWEVVYLTEESNLFKGILIDIGANPKNIRNKS